MINKLFVEEEADWSKQFVNRVRSLSNLAGESEENQMYRCPSYVRQPRSIELHNDQQAVYQRV